MPRCKVELLTEARFQLRDIATVYKVKVGVKSAQKITNRILAALRKLEDFPELGVIPQSALLEKGEFRMLIVDEYLCFYSREGDTLYVNQILHGSVDYAKWLLR
ncbi:MAG: type II toxin-antitoxin system RelE/ParE family toxin [Oscillospiraceae bacterium]